MICGIDYGSKLSGTTVCAWQDGTGIQLQQSCPKQDADAFLVDLLADLNVASVYVDAPLSLPAAYFDRGTNFFYRLCDVQLKAMSPLFLGGLTARAMHLAANYKSRGIPFYEAYPGGLWRLIGNKELAYKKNLTALPACIALLQSHFSKPLPLVTNWHQFDALLALLIGFRHQRGEAQQHGDAVEGLIYI